jgi:hypothetical protein
VQKQLGAVLLSLGLAAGLAALDAALSSAKGVQAESVLRVLPATALLTLFLLHRPVDRI